MELCNRNILVTGGSQGLGEATARILAARGGHVIVGCSRNLERAQAIAAEISGEAVRFDVSDPGAVEAAFRTLEVDILINNARCDPYARSSESDGEWFDRMIGVNLKGPYLCSLAAMERMKRKKWGRIVNISSVWAYRPAERRMLEYAMSKAALHSLTRSLAGLGASCGVTVNTVAPGLIFSREMHGRLSPEELNAKFSRIPVGRGAAPEEVVNAILFVIENSYVTGETVNINGGTDMC